MIDQDELLFAGGEPDPMLLELTEQIAERLQAGESVDAADYADRYPQWAGAIHKLLPTVHDLVDYGRAVDRESRPGRQPIEPNKANDRES